MAAVARIAGLAGAGTTDAISITHGFTIQAGDCIVVTITANADAGTLADNNGSTPFPEEPAAPPARARGGVAGAGAPGAGAAITIVTPGATGLLLAVSDSAGNWASPT